MNINLTLFAQAIVFAAFIWFTVRFVWPPMLRAIETRQKQIADGLAAAEKGRTDLVQAEKQVGEIVQGARVRAQEILSQSEKRAQEIIEEAKQAARAEGERLVAGAKAEIAQEVVRAREQLRAQVAALAVSGAEKILAREVDAKAHAEMLTSIQKQL
jgi:F-type H+-transporting ATPase subunit b